MALYAKLLKLQEATRALAQDKTGGNSQYNYISGNKLLNHIRPLMDKLGLLLLPEVTDIETERMDYAVRTGSKTEALTRVRMRFTWVDVETGETLAQDWGATGMNGFDKGFGSALTYGERYYLLKMLHIQTDADDVDAIIRDEEAVPAFEDIAREVGRARTFKELKGYYDAYIGVYGDRLKELLATRKQEIKEMRDSYGSGK